MVQVDAPNWVVAFGEALGLLGVDSPTHMAVETLSNSVVLIRDMRSGERYFIEPVG